MKPAGRLRTSIPIVLLVSAALGAILAGQQTRVPLAFATFPQLLQEYRTGDWQAAAGAFGEWQEELVSPASVVPPDADDETIAAMAMLHTDAGMAAGQFGVMAKGLPRTGGVGLGFWGLDNAFEPHSRRAFQLVEELIDRAEEHGSDHLREFARSWYISAMSYCHRWGRPLCTRSLHEKGESLFGDDPDFRLVMGSVYHDTRMTQARLEARRVPWVIRQRLSQEPRWHFKQAKLNEPRLIEARLRFAHIIHVYLNDPDGRAELEQVLREAQERDETYFVYLGALILGELHEDAGRLEDAAGYYAIAVRATPAHTASVALGQALVRLGRRDEGFEIGRRMFGLEGPGVEPIDDPYVQYQYAQFREVPDRLNALRAFGRRP
jgi:hypothetical protein